MKFRSTAPEEPEINLIPFIDVLLVIVIFLMISTTFNRFAELDMVLPQAEAKPSTNRKNELLIGVSTNGQYNLNGRVVMVSDTSQLAREIAKQIQSQKLDNPNINIYADGNAPHQYVINVMEAARLNNLNRVTFSTRK